MTPPSDRDDRGSLHGLIIVRLGSSFRRRTSRGTSWHRPLSSPRPYQPSYRQACGSKAPLSLVAVSYSWPFIFLLTSGESAAVTQHLPIRRASLDLMMRGTPAGRLRNFKHLAEPRRPSETIARAARVSVARYRVVIHSHRERALPTHAGVSLSAESTLELCVSP